MNLMYANDSRYRTLSALLVVNGLWGKQGSVQIAIQQPDGVRSAAYNNETGTGTPVEITSGQGEQVYLYAPAVNTYTTLNRPLSFKRPVLKDVPLTVIYPDYGGTDIYGTAAWDGGLNGIANTLTHPAWFIQSPSFQGMEVTVTGPSLLGSRQAWQLQGSMIAGTSPLIYDGRSVDGLRMWVDVATGIILRIETYSGSVMTGWAELTHLSIDGPADTADTPAGTLSAWSLPLDARLVSRPEYIGLAPTR
jgi:hypothetical protein